MDQCACATRAHPGSPTGTATATPTGTTTATPTATAPRPQRRRTRGSRVEVEHRTFQGRVVWNGEDAASRVLASAAVLGMLAFVIMPIVYGVGLEYRFEVAIITNDYLALIVGGALVSASSLGR